MLSLQIINIILVYYLDYVHLSSSKKFILENVIYDLQSKYVIYRCFEVYIQYIFKVKNTQPKYKTKLSNYYVPVTSRVKHVDV